MKKVFLIVLAFTSIFNAFGQEKKTKATSEFTSLPIIYISDEISLHFRSPEPINYVDVSTDKLVGDIPVDNVARFKVLRTDSTHIAPWVELGVITIVGQSYLAQYRLIYKDAEYGASTEVEILPQFMKPLEFPKVTLTNYELQKICLEIQQKDKKMKNVVSKGLGLTARLNNIYAFGNYIFMDITFENKTNIKYDIDLITFSIDDKKIYKATNNQSIDIKPFYKLYWTKEFKRSHRNIFVFEKFTFPNDKVFRIRMAENQISGRSLDLLVEYRDLLNADTF